MNNLMKNVFATAIMLLSLWQMSFTSSAQGVSVNLTGTAPDTSAILDVSSTDKGMLVPRMTTVQRNAIFSPASGLMIFNIDCNEFQFHTSSGWMSVINSSSVGTPGAISGSSSFCSGQTGVAYQVAPVPGATTYTWAVPAGATVASGQGTNSIIVNFGANPGFISVNAGDGCGTGQASNLVVSLSANPVVPGSITGSSSVCSAQSGVAYSVVPVSGATSYSWTVPAGATITSGAGTNSISVTFGSTSGNITVASVNACGTSSPATLVITITTVPSVPGTISGTTNPSPNQSGVTYSISAVSGATSYTWTVPSGATITAGQGTTGITVTFGSASGNVCVTADNSCGSGTAACLAINICSATGTQTFTYVGSITTFTVPACVTSLTIEAWGAEGGRGKQYNTSYYSSGIPGKGARMKGTFTVTPGETIKVLVGQKGGEKIVSNQLGGGGGGGSFVTRNNNTAMIVAGGGGGSGRYDGDNGSDGNTSTSGTAGNGSNGGAGGSGGSGGIIPSCSYAGGSGAGLTGNGQNHGGSDAQAFVNGGAGASAGTSWSDGNTGGFGGGGGTGPHGGGGAGGYSGGGGGGDINCGGNGGGGGGGSYNGGTAQSNSPGIQTGNGQVTITW